MQLFNFLKIFPSFWTFGQQYYKTESIYLNSWDPSHKKKRDSLETQVILFDIFAWTWNTWWWLYWEYIKTAKNGTFFCEELLSENDFEAVLDSFCCYDYDTNASKAVQVISTRTLDLYANSLKQLIL